MQINRVCEFFLDQTNSSNLPAFPLMSYPGPPGSPRHRFFHGSLPDPTWMSRSSCILTRLFPEFTQMFLHTLLETRDFDLLSTLETLLDHRYRPRAVTILPGKMFVTPLIIKITISYFPLIHLPSCYRTVQQTNQNSYFPLIHLPSCYRTVQQTNQIESCSSNQPINI